MTVWTGTLPTWLVEEIPAADLDTMTDVLAALTDAWSTYTVAWTSAGTAPAIGNGTLTGRYVQAGKLVWVHISWRPGSTTTFGSGRYFFSLPVNGRTNRQPGAGYIFDSGTANRSAICGIDDGLTKIFMVSSADGDVGATIPQTFANGDSIECFIAYEVA